MKTIKFINAAVFTTSQELITGGKMQANINSNGPVFEGSYVPYFYQSGLFQLYLQPTQNVPAQTNFVPSAGYDFTSDLTRTARHPVPPTVEQIIARGYFAIPKSEPETALISDKKTTAWLGLDDIIGQIQRRQEIYLGNMYDLELAKCAAANSLHQHEAHHGPADAKVEYALNKRLDKLYTDQRDERVKLWQDVSRLRQTLPETAQQYLSAYRKVSILEDTKGDAL